MNIFSSYKECNEPFQCIFFPPIHRKRFCNSTFSMTYSIKMFSFDIEVNITLNVFHKSEQMKSSDMMKSWIFHANIEIVPWKMYINRVPREQHDTCKIYEIEMVYSPFETRYETCHRLWYFLDKRLSEKVYWGGRSLE